MFAEFEQGTKKKAEDCRANCNNKYVLQARHFIESSYYTDY